MSMRMPRDKLILAPTLIFFFICSTEARVSINDQLDKQISNNKTGTSFPSSSVASKFDWIQQEFLKAHNDLRSSAGVPPLQWDANLATFANSWATQRKQDCNYRQHSSGPYGENIFWQLYKETNAAGVVKKWYAEKQFFDHVKNVCKCQPEKEGCECGHYLNVIWKTTNKVGCSGFVYCNNQKGVYVVCSYDPIGSAKGVNPLNPTGSTSTIHSNSTTTPNSSLISNVTLKTPAGNLTASVTLPVPGYSKPVSKTS